MISGEIFSDHIMSGDTVLLCPTCRYEYTHLQRVFTRACITAKETNFLPIEGTTDVDIVDGTERRDALVLVFKCEMDHVFEVIFQQHKGNTYIEYQNEETKGEE